MFVCPPVEISAVQQVLTEDGAAWRLIDTPEGACLYRVDDRDEAGLVKQWEGKHPTLLLPLSEGVVAVGERWLAQVGPEGARWIGGSLPAPPDRACEVEGVLRVEAAGRSWVVTDDHLLGPVWEDCPADPAQRVAATGAPGTR
jgi:hypothetical protein